MLFHKALFSLYFSLPLVLTSRAANNKNWEGGKVKTWKNINKNKGERILKVKMYRSDNIENHQIKEKQNKKHTKPEQN